MQHHQDSHMKETLQVRRENTCRRDHSRRTLKFVNLDDAAPANTDWCTTTAGDRRPMQLKSKNLNP